VAVQQPTASRLGTLYNEIPDRISDTLILVGAGYALGGNIILGFVAALTAMFTAYVRAMGKVAGANQEFCGPMAKQQRMALLTIVAACLAMTPVSLQPIWRGYGLVSLALVLIIVGSILTAGRRLRRIACVLGGGQD
jgi:phosphatidylglycerophosphate synthase